MDLHYLEIFNTVAKYSSYKRASEVLHISQPALSIQVKKLEKQIDLKLFYRTGSKLYLSESGIMLYEYTSKIFALVEDMKNHISQVSNSIGGTINLGGSNTPGTCILPTAIGEMKKLYPMVTFNLHIGNTSEITSLIENGTLDVAVSGGNCEYNNTICMEKLIDDKLVVVASPMNELCKREHLMMEDLSGECFIVHETTSQLYNSFKTFIYENHIPENISMYLGSIEAIKNAVYANLGISIMPYYAVKLELELGRLKELNLAYDDCIYPYSLIYNKNKSMSVTTLKFVEILKNICKSSE